MDPNTNWPWDSWHYWYPSYPQAYPEASSTAQICVQAGSPGSCEDSTPVSVTAHATGSASSSQKNAFFLGKTSRGQVAEVIDLEGPTSYNVKVINPSKKSDYFIRKWRTRIRFQDIESLQDKLHSDHGEIVEMGYIEPGHGARGKQHWILNAGILKTCMKLTQEKQKSCSGCTPQVVNVQARVDESVQGPRFPQKKETKSRKSDAHAKKLVQVEEIADELEVQHGGAYTREQYSVWAHMIDMRKHESRDIPPDKPFFKGSKGKKKSTLSDPSTSSTDPLEISPGKRIYLRTQCIDQLEKWHCLLEKGIISEEQYKKLQGNILGDTKKF